MESGGEGAGFRVCLHGRSVGPSSRARPCKCGYQWGQVRCRACERNALDPAILTIWLGSHPWNRVERRRGGGFRVCLHGWSVGPSWRARPCECGYQWGQVWCRACETNALGPSMLTTWLGSHPWNRVERRRGAGFRVCLHSRSVGPSSQARTCECAVSVGASKVPCV